MGQLSFAVVGAKATTDFKVLTDVAVLNQFVTVVFLEDQIALEKDETFYLSLKARGLLGLSGPNVFFCNTINITIIDSDGMFLHMTANVNTIMYTNSEISVYFVEEVFLAIEGELKIPVVVEKNKKIASPLTVQLRPLSIANVTNSSTVAQAFYPNMCSCTRDIDSDFIGKHYRLKSSDLPISFTSYVLKLVPVSPRTILFYQQASEAASVGSECVLPMLCPSRVFF